MHLVGLVAVAAALSITVAAQQPLSGSRLLVLLFDVNSMGQDDLARAASSGTEYVNKQMTDSDLVAVAALGAKLTVLSDFTSNRQQLTSAFGSLASVEAAKPAADTTAATSETVRALRTLCETLTPIQQRKAVPYFSSGLQRAGGDNQELRAATNSCNRGNVTIYPVDARGLTANVTK
jgi:VWFA-related protein